MTRDWFGYQSKLQCIVHQPYSEYSARRDSLIVRRVSEFDHLPHIVWPLEGVAVNEEQWLSDASLRQVSVDG